MVHRNIKLEVSRACEISLLKAEIIVSGIETFCKLRHQSSDSNGSFRKKQKREKKVKEGWEEGRKAGMDSRKEQNSYIILNLDWRRQ